MDGMDLVLHDPSSTAGQNHQAPPALCPAYMVDRAPLAQQVPPPASLYYEPVHNHHGPWPLSPPVYQWPPHPAGLLPHSQVPPPIHPVNPPDHHYFHDPHHPQPFSQQLPPYMAGYNGPAPPYQGGFSMADPPENYQSNPNDLPGPPPVFPPPISSASSSRPSQGYNVPPPPLPSGSTAVPPPLSPQHPSLSDQPGLYRPPDVTWGSRREHPEPSYVDPSGNNPSGSSYAGPSNPRPLLTSPSRTSTTYHSSPRRPGTGSENSTASSSANPEATPTSPTTNAGPLVERRRAGPARNRRPFSRIYSERGGEMDEDIDAALMEQMMNARPGQMNDEHLRAAQFFRGSVSTKMVASPQALRSLESVDVSQLPQHERLCVICYNEFGHETPEGVKEAPLRLPKCKHVFGDHCIKKWFEESDSCPYCRDKLPSEPRVQATSRAFVNFLRMRNSNGGVTGIEHDVYFRAITRDLENRQGGGGRRSPPADGGGRRQRPRHGSRGSGSPPAAGSRPSSFAGPSTTQQAVPTRERGVNAPTGPHWRASARYSQGPPLRNPGAPGPRPVGPAAISFHAMDNMPSPPLAPAQPPNNAQAFGYMNGVDAPPYNNPLGAMPPAQGLGMDGMSNAPPAMASMPPYQGNMQGEPLDFPGYIPSPHLRDPRDSHDGPQNW